MTGERFDLVVVGSGPVGAAIARTVFDEDLGATILMVEVGPQLSPRAGMSVRNLPADERAIAELRSQGPAASDDPRRPDEGSGAAPAPARVVPRPGTFLVNPEATLADPHSGMPAAVMSANVGGLGAHWTCACPRPGNAERIEFIPAPQLDDVFSAAERLLGVTADAYPTTPVREAVERVLGEIFDDGRPADRVVQAMPLAAAPHMTGRPHWNGADTILGDLAEDETRDPRFTLAAETLATRLVVDGDQVVGVELRDMRTGRTRTVSCGSVAVAADPFRTPQLLWASGIRPRALGRYLNDQPQIMCAVYLDPGLAPAGAPLPSVDNARELVTGVSWIPFHAPGYPFHGQIMQRDASPMLVGEQDLVDPRPVVGLGCFTTKEIRFEDRVEFSADELDVFGMPAPRIHYELTEQDQATIRGALALVEGLVERLGVPVPGGAPRLVPAGSSIHYQGSVRMGPADDGTSVCDSEGRVWGFRNLHVGGNGVIPTATASNPTLTSVALGVRTARSIARSREGAST